MEYIDLGLRSRTLWQSDYERDDKGNCLYLTFDEAKERFGDSLPEPWQFRELRYCCKWEWDNEKQGYKVTGPNGNSIFLAAMGLRYRYSRCVAYVGLEGYLWASFSSATKASYLGFNSSFIFDLHMASRAYGIPVLCVQEQKSASHA